MDTKQSILSLTLLMLFNTNVISDDTIAITSCNKLYQKEKQRLSKEVGLDFDRYTTNHFYSKKYDSCVYTQIANIGNAFIIRDLSQTIIRDGPIYFSTLLNCGHDGANSANMEAIRRFRGKVYNVAYKEWLDDGYGVNQPLYRPDKTYTPCARLYIISE